jgi:hypothetical protein
MISEDIAAGIAAGAVGVGYAMKYLMSKLGSGSEDGARERNQAHHIIIRSLRDEIGRLNDVVGSLSSRLDEEIDARRRLQDENGRQSRKIFALEAEVRLLGGTIA